MAPWQGQNRRRAHPARVVRPRRPTNLTPGFGRWARYFPVARPMGYAVHVSTPSRPLPELL